MKSKTIKRIACVLSAAILVTSISYYGPKDEPVVVQAEETLFGIQKIKSNQFTQGGTYTVLELVPDIAAAEFGYMVPGMEPAISSWDAATGEWTAWQKELGNYQTEDERRAYVERLKGELDAFLTTYGFTDADGNSVGNAPVWYETYQESAVPVQGYEKLPIASTTVKGYFDYIGRGEGYDVTFLPYKEFDDMTGNEFDVTGHYYYGVGEAITNENFGMLVDEDKLYVLDNYGVNYVYQGTWGELKDTLLMVEPEVPENNENPLTVTDGDANYLSSVTAGDAQSIENPVADIENTENPVADTQNTESSVADAVSDRDDAVVEEAEDENFAAPGDTILNPDLQTYYLASFTTLTPDLAMTNDPELKLNPKTMIYTIDMDSIVSSATGEYELVENEAGYEFVFTTNSIYYTGGFVNGEWFREKVLNMEPDEAKTFRVKVVTMTYDQFNARVVDATSTLPAYDLLYLNSGSRGVNVTNRLDTTDLTEYAMERLFLDLLDAEKPCLLDASILYETAADGTIQARNAYKAKYLYYMCTMLSQESPASCYDEVNGNKTVDEWLSTVKADADKNFVAENVYSFYGSLMNPGFLANTIYSPEMEAVQEGFQDVLDEINTENYYRETDNTENDENTGEYEVRLVANNISQATAVRHVINYVYRRNSKVKNHIRVLEIQPARVYRGTEDAEELNEEIVRSWIPDGDKVETVEITTMTTAEFIGKIEDINAKYDLIYIGTETDFMNVNDWGQTVFNDPNMNHLIYFHTGDKRYAGMELSGTLDTDYAYPNAKDNSDVYGYVPVRYGGNDITKEKRDALDAFLNASYPVVVSDKFFNSPVTIYTDANYYPAVTARSATGLANLGVGQYDMGLLWDNYGIGNDDVSSLRVSRGYEVTFYENVNFDGASVSFTESTGFVGADYNDWMTSMSVKRIDGVETERTVNTDCIDNSSFMYQFVKDALGKENLFSVSDVNVEGGSEAFNFYLNRPKVDFTNIQVNGNEYTKENNYRIYEIQPKGKKYTLEYDFTITNEGASSINTTYECELFIDVNADGKYSDSEELGDITITWNGQEVPANQLYADRNYKLTRVLPDGYKGVLPWEIQLSQNNNAFVHNAITGYTKLMNQPVEVINVLQICRPPVTEKDWWGGANEKLFNLSEQVITEGNVYHALIQGGEYNGITYPGIGNDYIINFEFRTTDDYEKEYNEYMNTHPGQATTDFFKYGFEDNDDTTDKSIDMLILGFSDAYDDISGAPLQGIIDFIGSGKSVLFAHDTMMFWNHSKYKSDGTTQRKGITNRVTREGNESGEYYCSYDLGQGIRSLVGMDRYGVMNNQYLRAGTGFGAGDTEAWASLDASKDKAYTAKSAGTSVVPEVQGYTYVIINAKYGGGRKRTFTENEIGTAPFSNTYTNLKYPPVVYYYDDGGSARTDNNDNGEVTNANAEVTNLLVTKTNSGQITDYPYKLDDQFQVSKTHGQYYQLDFMADDDEDGQSDLVVWFCLGGRNNGNSGEYQETIYSASPNDAANNYYIYNKGNVTYTGVGHAGTNEEHTLDEAKLFVNTMIAAYRAGITDPSISCLSNGLPGAAEIKATYSFYDAGNNISMVPGGYNDSRFEKVYFKATDYNVVSGERYINVNCYYPSTEAGSVQINNGGNNVSVKKLTDLNMKAYYQSIGIPTEGLPEEELKRNQYIYEADSNEVVANGSLESGEIYYILIPKVFIQQNMNKDGMFNIYLEAQSTITRRNLTDPQKPYKEETSKVYTEFSFTRVNLFELE